MTISKLSFGLLGSSALAATLGLAPVLSGCGTEPIGPAPLEARSSYDDPVVGVKAGRLQGQVGPASVDAAADPLAAYAAMSTLRVLGVAREEARAVMMQVTLRIDEIELVPGVIERFGADDLGRLVLLGCVGQAIDTYDEFDRPANDVELVVERAPDGGAGDVSVQVTGTWEAGTLAEPVEPATVASFSFVLVR